MQGRLMRLVVAQRRQRRAFWVGVLLCTMGLREKALHESGHWSET